MNNRESTQVMRCWAVVAAVAAAVSGAVGGWAYAGAGAGTADILRDLAVGWAYAGAGLAAWWRRPANATGPLMTAVGVTWFLGNLQGTTVPALFAAGAWWEGLNVAVLAHLVLAYPDGRTDSPAARRLVLMSYGLVASGGLLRTLAFDPAARPDGSYLTCRDCGPNPLFVPALGDLFPAVDAGYRAAGWAISLAVVAVVVRRWRRASVARRRALLPAWLAVLVATSFLLWDVLVVLVPAGQPVEGAVGALSDVAQTAVPLAFLAGLLRMRLQRAEVGGLVMEVGGAPDPGRLREALVPVLGDPGLRLGVWRPEEGAYVDAAGEPVEEAAAGSTRIDAAGGTPLALLRHDPAVAEDAELLGSAVAALRLALENVWLQAEARAAGARVVQAADSERRRLERDLHDGAQARLVFALMALRRVEKGLADHPDEELRRSVGEVEHSLRLAVEELRGLAHGIHPAVLTREGLASALRELAGRAELPVVVAAEDRRFAPHVEATAYFTVSEALANAAKHARARAVSVSARHRDGRLVVEAVDDGVGGARHDHRGGGLRGLADRVSAVGGVLTVHSPPGEGTRVVAELPCE
ncbi:sensor histidine kinase [Streptomyces synnematoformans]|uniref:histidine kinase n=1 Tax=Streptomyces synnematoformans TaxID=415721 RepID=A0ABP5KUI8_9ACTN